jgi:serine/threonine-protein kinase
VAALGLGFAAYKAMAAREAPTAAAASLPPSIALLPLSDQSPTQDQRYFADGLTDQLAAQLSVYAPIRVVGRDTTLPLKAKGMTPGAIGSQVKTSTVMEGSVRRDGDRIRVSVQLVDSRSGYLLWSETYDRPFKDLFGLQDEITRAILGKLRLELQPGVRTDMVGLHTKNPEAFDQYLLAHMVVKDDETGGRRVLGALRKAVELDPTFYEAWLSLADGLSWAQYPDDAGEALEGKREAMRALDRAIAIAPERGEGWLLRGDLRYCLWWEWQKAEEDLERGAQLGFRDKSEYLLRKIRLQAALGDLEGAIALARRAARLEPAQVTPLLVMAYHLTALDRFEEAERTLDQIVLIRPDNEHAHYYLGLGKLLRGRPGEAIRHFDDSAYVFRLTGQAMAWHALGNRARSDQFLELLRQRYGHIYPYNIANVHAYRGEKDQAFQWLDRACDQHDASLMYLLWDPLLRGLHGDPRFKALLKRVNLPPKPIPA